MRIPSCRASMLAPQALLLGLLLSCSERPPTEAPRAADAATDAQAAAPALPPRMAHSPSPTFAFSTPLSRVSLVRAVLERNPDIAMAQAAWRAAEARQAQRSAWDDPMLSYAIAPLTIGHGAVGENIQLSQRLPLGGKLDLQREIAQAEADAARSGITAVRHRLALLASQLFDDYRLAEGSLVVVREHQVLAAQLKGSATAHVASGTASFASVLQAEMSCADLADQLIALEGDRDVAKDELNALLHREPSAILPPPDPVAELPMLTQSVEQLQAEALAQRPELARAQATVHGDGARGRLDRRQYLPDVAVMGSYDSMWAEARQQYMLGISFAIPLQRDRLRGAVDEAQAMLDQHQLELEHLAIEIQADVAASFRRWQAAQASAAVLSHQLAPAAQSRWESARIGLSAATADFASVVAAERDLLDVRLRLLRNDAERSRRAADVQRAIGLIPVLATKDMP